MKAAILSEGKRLFFECRQSPPDMLIVVKQPVSGLVRVHRPTVAVFAQHLSFVHFATRNTERTVVSDVEAID